MKFISPAKVKISFVLPLAPYSEIYFARKGKMNFALPLAPYSEIYFARWQNELGAFHLSYKVIKRLKVTGYTWNGYLRQMLGQQAEN